MVYSLIQVYKSEKSVGVPSTFISTPSHSNCQVGVFLPSPWDFHVIPIPGGNPIPVVVSNMKCMITCKACS